MFCAATSCGVGPAGTSGAAASFCATATLPNKPATTKVVAFKNLAFILVGLRCRDRHIQEFDSRLLFGDAHRFSYGG